MHGGSAPQVKAKAAQRLAAFIDPHLEQVAKRIIEGLDAQETKFFQKDGLVTDTRDVIAWGERRAYAETAMKALGIVAEKEPEPVTPLEVTINVVGSITKA